MPFACHFGLFLCQVEDFENIIQHYDERLAQYLNELYLNEEWSFGKEEFSKQKLPNELPVNRDFRLNNVSCPSHGIKLFQSFYRLCNVHIRLTYMHIP